MSVQVWEISTNNWIAIKTYNELFYTPKGALSPNSGATVGTGAIVEPKDGYGTMNSQYTVTFTGALATGLQLTGFLGIKNYGGTVAIIMSGANNNAPNYYSWLSQYFPSATSVAYKSDSWTYQLFWEPTAVATHLVETNAYGEGPSSAVGDIIT